METEKTYYMLWDCGDCGHKGIPASPHHRYCPSCNHPRTFEEFDSAYLLGDEETFDLHQQVEVSKADAKRLEKVGPSWFCRNCSSDNYGDETHCHHCEAPKKGDLLSGGSYKTLEAYTEGDQGKTSDLVDVFGGYAGQRAAQGLSFDPDDTHENQHERANRNRSAFRKEMSAPHASRPEWEDSDLPSSKIDEEGTETLPELQSEKALAKRPPLTKHGKAAAVIMITTVGFLALLIWGNQTYEVKGSITDMYWEREIQIERWETITKSDWQHLISPRPVINPVQGSGEVAGVDIISCQDKHFEDRPYVCGVTQVPCKHNVSYVEKYSCQVEEDYYVTKPCTKTQSYQESYTCSKKVSYTCGTYSCRCRTRRNSNGTASRTCSTCTKKCFRSQPSTCYRTKSKEVSSTCRKRLSRMVDSTCSRTKYKKRHAYDEEDKICHEPIYRPYCSYRTQKWMPAQKFYRTGKDHLAKWPQHTLGFLERENRKESYTITMEGPKMPPKTKTLSFAEFRTYRLGTPVTYTVTNFGSVISVRR